MLQLRLKLTTILLLCINTSVPLANQTPEEIQSDEQLDCQVMELIRDEILPQAALYPPHFISKIMGLLNKGSIHLVDSGYYYHTSALFCWVVIISLNLLCFVLCAYIVNSETGPKLREEFARVCFEVLLQFSLLHEEQKHQHQEQVKISAPNSNQVTNQLAITALLDRFHKVLAAFAQDGKTGGQCPMPRWVFSYVFPWSETSRDLPLMFNVFVLLYLTFFLYARTSRTIKTRCLRLLITI